MDAPISLKSFSEFIEFNLLYVIVYFFISL